jgi:hypothetical protein
MEGFSCSPPIRAGLKPPRKTRFVFDSRDFAFGKVNPKANGPKGRNIAKCFKKLWAEAFEERRPVIGGGQN